MDPFTLTAEALREPWRLWTCHLVHFGWEHVLANAVALAVPAALTHRNDHRRLLATLLVAAPLLSLLLLPDLADGQYRGASGLACVMWAWVGLRLVLRWESFTVGLALQASLALKLAVDAALGTCFLPPHPGWQALPEAHSGGALLGLIAALPALVGPRSTAPQRA
jgi:membrane associated rhomboid family serine protease